MAIHPCSDCTKETEISEEQATRIALDPTNNGIVCYPCLSQKKGEVHIVNGRSYMVEEVSAQN